MKVSSIQKLLDYKPINFYSNYIVERYNKHLFTIYHKNSIHSNLYALRQDDQGKYYLSYHDGYNIYSSTILNRLLTCLVQINEIENIIA